MLQSAELVGLNPTRTGIQDSLHAYKGFALCGMIGLHTYVWWYSKGIDGQIELASPQALILLNLFLGLMGWLSLSFAFTAGVSYVIWIKSQQVLLGKWPSPSTTLFRAGIFMGIGFWLNPQSWYIFQFLGLSVLVTYVVLRLSGFWGVALLGVLVSGLSDFLRDFTSSWPLSYWKVILIGENEGRYFWPFFPWFSLFALGVIVGRIKLSRLNEKPNLISNGMILIGLVLLNSAGYYKNLIPQIDVKNLWGPAIFQPNTITFYGWSGLILATYGAFDYMSASRFRKLTSWAIQMSYSSLLVYVIHYRVFVKFVFAYKGSGSWIRLMGAILIQILIAYLVSALVFKVIRAKKAAQVTSS
jgi:uncharacterized membrane protein